MQRRSSHSAPSATRPITGRGSARSASSSRPSGPPLRLAPSGLSTSPALASVSTGSAPLPIWLHIAATSTDQPAPSAACSGARSRSAAAAMSARGRVNRRSVGSRSASLSGSRYSRSTGSSAASVSLPTRSARFSGFFLIFAIRSRRPTISPACGPPSSLSPLKLTTSAPAVTMSRTVGSRARPCADRSTSVPLPRSTASGRPRAWAMRATSASGTDAVKPVSA